MISMVLDDVAVSRRLMETIDVLCYHRFEQTGLLEDIQGQMGRGRHCAKDHRLPISLSMAHTFFRVPVEGTYLSAYSMGSYFSQRPWPPRNAGMPASTEMPAPVKATMCPFSLMIPAIFSYASNHVSLGAHAILDEESRPFKQGTLCLHAILFSTKACGLGRCL